MSRAAGWAVPAAAVAPRAGRALVRRLGSASCGPCWAPLRAGAEEVRTALSTRQSERWVGRRVQPSDAAFTLLPWGFVSQEVVASKIVPETLRRRSQGTSSSMFSTTRQLGSFGYDVASVQDGAEAAYRFVAREFNRCEAGFATRLAEQMDPSLGALFDSQLVQLQGARREPGAGPMVEVHAVHECIVTCAFPLMLVDPTNPEEIEKSIKLFKMLGVNSLTAQLHYANIMLSRLWRQAMSERDHGLRLAVEVLIKSSETVRFGPEAGAKRDAMHVLWFYGGRNKDILSADSLDFELANWNEALSMIQDTATPDAWQVQGDA
jgi:hypothetical protein